MGSPSIRSAGRRSLWLWELIGLVDASCEVERGQLGAR